MGGIASKICPARTPYRTHSPTKKHHAVETFRPAHIRPKPGLGFSSSWGQRAGAKAAFKKVVSFRQFFAPFHRSVLRFFQRPSWGVGFRAFPQGQMTDESDPHGAG